MSILVTGGYGFIGSNFILDFLNKSSHTIINLDKISYASNINSLNDIHDFENYIFYKGDINDPALVKDILHKHNPTNIINFAAESHVDRSIVSPNDFIQSNIVGTYNLLELSKQYWNNLSINDQKKFRFLHVSTDEVFGSLKKYDAPFNETSPYAPNSPYSASKASSDHLVRSYFFTYGLPTIITNCSNNYGPHQYPEKLIPLVIHNCLKEIKIPIYGSGENIRDWIYVLDHCNALMEVLKNGVPGEMYNIGGNEEKENIEVVNTICSILDIKRPRPNKMPYKDLIDFVKDRPGHDMRYAIDCSKIKNELDWLPKENFTSGINKTIEWYLNNQKWLSLSADEKFSSWVRNHYK